MNGSAQRPLALCTIRETYWNKAGTESPAVGGFIWRAAGHWLNFDQHSCSTSPFFFSQPQTGQWTLPPTGGHPGILATGPSLTLTRSCVLARGALSHYFIYHEIPTYGWWFSYSTYGGCSIWKITATLGRGLLIFDMDQRKSLQWLYSNYTVQSSGVCTFYLLAIVTTLAGQTPWPLPALAWWAALGLQGDPAHLDWPASI